ncbi:uncharacterized protein LOC143372499 isoform X1 [Andrena cerasifolii]|uniref:uncharacterized protein LOC143372499 isoform X1 n=1 Tax=Andrena cerasifolii TaxID=2819439 RepID=UPI0040383628
MDNSDKQEQNHDESNSAGNEKDESQERINSKPYFTPKQNQSGCPHSRSRSPINIRSPIQWRSSNAFVNFLHEFRQVGRVQMKHSQNLLSGGIRRLQNFTSPKSRRIFQLAGERWRQMSPKEKQPFVWAAAGIRSRLVNQQRNEEVNKSNKNTEESKKETPRGKQTRRIKKSERNSKKRQQVKKKNNTSESDTDSATSGTAGSRTSGDISNESS